MEETSRSPEEVVQKKAPLVESEEGYDLHDVHWMRRWNWLKYRLSFWAVHILVIGFAYQTYSHAALAVCLVLFVVASLGVEMGYHRLFTHQAFETYPIIRYMLAFFGLLACQDGPLGWSAVHRKHHKYEDTENDPHSPHKKGFFWAHTGWMYRSPGLMKSERYLKRWIPDLLKDKWLVRIDARDDDVTFLSMVALYLAGGWPFFIWGWCVRQLMVWHSEFAINSICHMFGRQPWKTGDQSRNVWWLSLPTLGQSWHNNHHYLPRSARVGFTWWQLDPTWWLIWTLEKCGLVWNVVRPSDYERKLRANAAEEAA